MSWVGVRGARPAKVSASVSCSQGPEVGTWSPTADAAWDSTGATSRGSPFLGLFP